MFELLKMIFSYDRRLIQPFGWCLKQFKNWDIMLVDLLGHASLIVIWPSLLPPLMSSSTGSWVLTITMGSPMTKGSLCGPSKGHGSPIAIAQTGKFANCVPEISKIYCKLYREHQNCAPKILVARYKLSRLGHSPHLWPKNFNALWAFREHTNVFLKFCPP